MPGRWAFNTIVLPAVTSSNLCPPAPPHTGEREREETQQGAGPDDQWNPTFRQENPGCYFKTIRGIRLLRTMTLHHLQQCWLWLVGGEVMVTWLGFLSSHHPVGFAGSDLLFPLLQQKLRDQTKGQPLRGRGGIFWKYFHFPSKELELVFWLILTSAVTILSWEQTQCWWSLPPLLPPLCWKSKTGICGFDCNNLNWIKCLHYHLVSTSSGCWVLTKLVMTSMINHYEWLGFSQSSKKYSKFLCFSVNDNTVWKPWISTTIVQHEFWCEFGQFSY